MNVLVFGIHPDDIELGCGGTVAVCTRAGYRVTLVDLSRGESSSNGTVDGRASEASTAAGILGSESRVNLGLPDAGIHSEDPEQQRTVVSAIRKYRPQVVLIPFAHDPHPDHASGGVLIERALYLAGVHGYPVPDDLPAWKTPTTLTYSGRDQVRPDVVVDITAVRDIKQRAIEAHASQFGGGDGALPTPLNAPDFLAAVEARDRAVGQLAGVRFGEAFQSARPVVVQDFGVFASREDR